MIQRTDILAEMGRKRVTLRDLSRRSGKTEAAIRAFLDGGDAKLSTIDAITNALGGELSLFFAADTQSTKGAVPNDAA